MDLRTSKMTSNQEERTEFQSPRNQSRLHSPMEVDFKGVSDMMKGCHQRIKPISKTSMRSKDILTVFLNGVLEQTGSEYGFVCVFDRRKNSQSTEIKVMAITDTFSGSERDMPPLNEVSPIQCLELLKMDTFYHKVVESEHYIIANNLLRHASHPSSSRDQPNLESFLGVPMYTNDQFLGILGIANRPGGYNESVLHRIYPLVFFCSAQLLLLNARSTQDGRREFLDVSQPHPQVKTSEGVCWLYHLFLGLKERRTLDSIYEFFFCTVLERFSPIDGYLYRKSEGQLTLYRCKSDYIHPDIPIALSSFSMAPFQDHCSLCGSISEIQQFVPIEPNTDTSDDTMTYICVQNKVSETLEDGNLLGLCVFFIPPIVHSTASFALFRLASVQFQTILREVCAHQESKHLLLERVGDEDEATEAVSGLAEISHEIKTPLSGLIGSIDLLATTYLNAVQRELVDSAKESSELLNDLLNDILDQHKFRSGIVPVEKKTINLISTIEFAFKLFKSRADTSKIKYELCIGPSVPRQIRSDDVPLKQILCNLLSNAIKFTEKGFVRLSAYLVDSLGFPTLVIEVYNSGKEICESARSRIFKPFLQEKEHTNFLQSGHGLGLYMVRKLVKELDGEVSVSSTPGKGCTFRVALRADIVSDAEHTVEMDKASIKEMMDKDAVRFLIADDDPMQRRTLREFLRSLGFHSQSEARNGKEALDLALSNPYTIIMLDLHMPVMSGLEAAHAIVQRCSSPPPIIVSLSAEDSQSIRQSCASIGIQHVISKPVRRETLIQVLKEALKLP